MPNDFTLSPFEVDLWQGTVNPEVDKQALISWLSEDERQRMQRFKFANLQARFLYIRSRLRQLLAGYVNERPDTLRMAQSEFGKPYLADYPELSFNVSHSDDDWIIAVGLNCQLGVDIERCKPRDSLAELVERFFAKPEISYWRTLPDSQRLPAFYRLWTCKEAFLKATGRGIAAGLDECILDTGGFQRFVQVPQIYRPAGQWQLLMQRTHPTHCVALVSQSTGAQTVRHKSIQHLELPLA